VNRQVVEDVDILRFVERACLRDPQLPVMIFEDGVVVTRERFWSDIESFAGYLESRVQPTEHVAVMLGNRSEFMVTWLATMACRAVLVSMNPTAKSHDARHILQDADVRLVIVDAEHAELFRGLQAECPSLQEIVVVEGDEPGGLSAYQGQWSGLRSADASHDITNVYYTSGTTGPPKGCMVDHEYWLHFSEVVMDAFEIGEKDRFLCCLQFFYNDPPWQLLVSLKARTSLVVMRRFSVSRYWDVVRNNDVTVLFGIASTAVLLLRAPLQPEDRHHKVRLAIQIGITSGLHRELVDRWKVPWVEGYGLTETGLLTVMPTELAEEMVGSGSIGRVCKGVAARVVDANDNDVAVNEIGEMIFQAPGLMRGYFNRPEATLEVLRGGWFHSGDLGRIDEQNFLYFQGRTKDIIRRGGENVAAAEVENVLRSHPKVVEAAAVPSPDDLRGEEVKVFVLLAPGESAFTITPSELVQFSESRLARYKVPRFVEYQTEDFERTPSMRVRKQDLDRSHDDESRVWDREKALGW
jgi:crotonobetaine/carnitine-CoA ligase